MDGMRNLSPMLEYSLDAFLHTFRVALREARQDRILENRLKSLVDKVTQLSYDYISLGNPPMSKHKIPRLLVKGDTHSEVQISVFFS